MRGKSTPKHILMKFQNIGDKKDIIEARREEKYLMYKKQRIKEYWSLTINTGNRRQHAFTF